MTEGIETTEGKAKELEESVIVEALTHKLFLKKLREAAEITRKTGHEATFDVSLGKGHNFLFSPVIEGEAAGTERHTPYTNEERRALGKYWAKEIALKTRSLLDIHFHPAEDICPSAEDLGVLTIMASEGELLEIAGEVAREDTSPPTLGVGIVDEEGNIELLLLQIVSKKPPTTLVIEDFFENLADYRKKEDIVQAFNTSFLYKAIIVSLPAGAKFFPESEIRKLKTF